jgi:hypothetical protein
MPIIRRTQPRTALPRPSYAFGSTASRLAAAGLSPRQVDTAHPRTARIRGASHTAGQRRLTPAHNVSPNLPPAAYNRQLAHPVATGGSIVRRGR